MPAYEILSPTLKSFTFSPTSVIIPAPSKPKPIGSFNGYKPDLW